MRRRRMVIAVGALAAATAVLALAVTVLAVPVRGASMEPTLRSGDRVLLRPFGGSADRLSIVVGRFAERGPEVVKRVVAVGGDRVEIRTDGTVRVQPGGNGPWFVVENLRGEPGAECCTAEGRTGAGPARVPEGAVFLLGDNLAASADSRTEGWASSRWIRGEVWVRAYPVGRWGRPGGTPRLVPAN
ncbi:MAG: signal peptidase I [Sporichthyaceae bacterium]